MGRVRYDEVDKYGGQGGAGFFSLKDDGDTARVRFMYNGIDDVATATLPSYPEYYELKSKTTSIMSF